MTVVAHAALVVALPFVVPALALIAMLAAVIVRDRRAERAEQQQ